MVFVNREHVVEDYTLLPLLGFVTRIRCEGRRNFGDQKTDVNKELCALPID